tara:strand:- start:91 stop:963 length:873 start_codon:yes stop_codon:yes gene_type:complete
MHDLSTLESIGQSLQDVGYIARRSEILGLATALQTDCVSAGGSRTVILEGEPGTGKSAFADAVAKVTGAMFLAYQFHSWSDADELFVGIDVAAAVGGDAENVRQEGILAKVAKLSEHSTVVLLLDEIDKAPERTEYLLLDWLQTGRVPIKPGVHLQTDMNMVMTFITSNGARDLSEATKRRAARIMMNPLPVRQQEQLIRAKTGLDKGFVRLLWKLARAVAESEKNNALSIQEGIRLALSVWQHAEGVDDLKLLLSHWAARSQQGRTAIAQNKFDDLVRPTWAELKRARG